MDLYDLHWTDTTGDGSGNIGLGDSDLDGRHDVAAFDMDGDGYVEGYAWDTHGDGLFDTISVDSSGDGYLDAHGWDTDGNGQLDHIASADTGGSAVPVAEVQPTTTVGGPTNGPNDALLGLLPMADPYERGLIDRIIQSQNDATRIWTLPDNVVEHRY